MAATWRAYAQSVAFTVTPPRNLYSLYNAVGSGLVVKVRRIFMFNNQTGAVTGTTPGLVGIYRWDDGAGAPSGGSTVAPVKHDPSTGALSASIDSRTLATAGIGTLQLLRFLGRSMDEVSGGGNTLDELNTIPALNCLWDAGWPDAATIQPLTLRPGQGMVLAQPSSGGGPYTALTSDIEVEFTVE